MDSLDLKVNKIFHGKVVRKDLTNLLKKTVSVPSFVLEYLLGMYCASDDSNVIESGIEKIKNILVNNCVKPEQSELIKSKIRENGEYTIIDKLYVTYDESVDKYVAHFNSLDIAGFQVDSNFVIHNEKLLLGGVWCLIKIKYTNPNFSCEEESDFEFEIFNNSNKAKQKSKKKEKYNSPFSIENLKPIQMPSLNIDWFISQRKYFSKDEWILLLLRSLGYEGTELTNKQKLHYLLRVVPMIQKNYNLVELGYRGTGKSHIYSEISPYSILLSGGNASVASLFYNLNTRSIGLVGKWDTIVLDEVGGLRGLNGDTVNFLKNYMANGTFSRGQHSFSAEGSFSLEGNIFKSVNDMVSYTNLFEPFPENIRNDSAFFDRVHAYLPGWETPKLRNSLFTVHYGLLTDCIAEFFHAMRIYDFSSSYRDYFSLNGSFNVRDEEAIMKTYSGLAKLIYPDGEIDKEGSREILEYAIECRRRVKEQLKKISPIEFNDVDLGYIDNELNEEFLVLAPESTKTSFISDEVLQCGHIYSIGRSIKNLTGVYKLEFKLLDGTGKFELKNVEGIDKNSRIVNKSLRAGFNYFISNLDFINRIINPEIYDYSLFYSDLQSKGPSQELTVAEVIGLCSVVLNKPVMNSLVVVGRVVISGSMMPMKSSLEEIVMVATSAGARNILLPLEVKNEFDKLPDSLTCDINGYFYETPIEAVKTALGLTK